jgi:hypothetical protein
VARDRAQQVVFLACNRERELSARGRFCACAAASAGVPNALGTSGEAPNPRRLRAAE